MIRRPGIFSCQVLRSSRPVRSATNVSSAGSPSWLIPPVQAALGSCWMASISLSVHDQPTENLCVPITSSTSCDQVIFVDQAIDVSLSSDAVQVEVDRLGERFQRRGGGT